MENTEVVCANNYNLVRNTYKTKIEFEKNNYVNKKINAKDQKQMWKGLLHTSEQIHLTPNYNFQSNTTNIQQ